MFKKVMTAIGAVCVGLSAVFGVFYWLEKKSEKKVGGKLMRVNYRFTKEFDD
ncbi:hypothetical protein HMP0721_0821 [Pseudoramibacter alactolyticus ATCC 23263]|jgi:hypothetical protein|uniref:Stress-responsive transcriptional regulator PspC n=1 Tax=Pseudoramibacter alactolyticus ATCC 23263 TaxID=887929 RepID=E6MFR0_9FIRM|nr:MULTISPECIES: hypothetical protein [Pseudoramibacter]EFV02055.1 hypothetical protein HMP0721_0821 [Pseudoramibacter alactolyticus ATCC 23263]MBM6968283.1 stress-responsive transcriptional regulator PspC [Pseudoramibacter alactolyticus]